MQFKLLAIGTKMPTWVETGFYEYAKRLPAHLKLELVEIPALPRVKSADLQRLQLEEGKKQLSHIKTTDYVVALDVLGKSWSTENLVHQIKEWEQVQNTVCLLVGGPEGLSSECLARAQQKWSLSPLTLPHPLVRIVVAEQLYRAWSIMSNHPYHR